MASVGAPGAGGGGSVHQTCSPGRRPGAVGVGGPPGRDILRGHAEGGGGVGWGGLCGGRRRAWRHPERRVDPRWRRGSRLWRNRRSCRTHRTATYRAGGTSIDRRARPAIERYRRAGSLRGDQHLDGLLGSLGSAFRQRLLDAADQEPLGKLSGRVPCVPMRRGGAVLFPHQDLLSSLQRKSPRRGA